MKETDVNETTKSEKPEIRSQPVPLVDRLDPAIGEATSGVGALLTELIRRTLRSGVQKIDEEMHDFVEEKVDATVADRMPGIEKQTVRIAEETAQVTAFKECENLENKTKSEIEAVEHRVSSSTEQAVSQRLAELEERAKGTAATYRDQIKALGQRIREESARFSDELKALTSQLDGERERSARLQKELESLLDEKAMSLEAKVLEEADARKADAASIKEDIRQAGSGFKQELYKMNEQFESHLKSVELENQLMKQRLEELERPRGIKALWSKMTGKKKQDEEPEA